jgi:hypothetical protein
MTEAIGVMALVAGLCSETSLTAESIVGKLIAVALEAVAAAGVAIWAALLTVSSHGASSGLPGANSETGSGRRRCCCAARILD